MLKRWDVLDENGKTDEDKLRELAEQDKSAAEIADILERGIPAVQNRASLLEISLRTKRTGIAQHREKIIAMIPTHKVREIAEEIGCAYGSLRQWLSDENLKVRKIRSNLKDSGELAPKT